MFYGENFITTNSKIILLMKEVYLFLLQNDKKRIYKQTIENKEILYEEVVGTAFSVLLEDCKNKNGDECFYAYIKENDEYKQCGRIELKDRLLVLMSQKEDSVFDSSIVYFNEIESKTKLFSADIKDWIIQNHPGILNQSEKDALNLEIQNFITNKDFELTKTFNFKGDYKTSRNLFKGLFTELFQEEISTIYRKCAALKLPNPKIFVDNGNTIIRLILEQALADFQTNENKIIGIIDYHSNLNLFLKGFEFDTKTEAEAKAKSQLDEYLDKAKEYETKNEYDKARHFYNQALGFATSVQKEEIKFKIANILKKDGDNDKLNNIQSLKSKAERSETLGNVEEAINFYNTAYDKAIEINNREEQRIILKLLEPLKIKKDEAKGRQTSSADASTIQDLIISADAFVVVNNKRDAIEAYVEAKQLAVKIGDKASIKKIDKALKSINKEPINKKPFIILFVLLLLGSFVYYSAQNGLGDSGSSDTRKVDETAYVTASSFLNVRNGSDDSYPLLGMVSKGDSVYVLEELKKNNWKKISFNNATGWVSGDYLGSTPPIDIKYLKKQGILLKNTQGTVDLNSKSDKTYFKKNEKVNVLFENITEGKYRIISNNNELFFVEKSSVKISDISKERIKDEPKIVKTVDKKDAEKIEEKVELKTETKPNTTTQKTTCKICSGTGKLKQKCTDANCKDGFLSATCSTCNGNYRSGKAICPNPGCNYVGCEYCDYDAAACNKCSRGKTTIKHSVCYGTGYISATCKTCAGKGYTLK